jgi:hypothetical protein
MGTATISSPYYGIVDKSPQDLVSQGYAVDAMDVLIDEYEGVISKRKGIVPYLTAPLPGQRSVRKLYEYRQTDGDRYMIIVSSTSIFYSVGDGNATSIVGNLDETWKWSFSTINNILYATSNSTTPWSWDGTTFSWLTVVNSTGMVSGKYCVYWMNRWFIAGVTGSESTIFYSKVLLPQDLQTVGAANTIQINPADGDEITGLHITDDNRLIVTKNYATYEVTMLYADEFLTRQLSNSYGCLYGSSLSNYYGSSVFVSARGAELYDGTMNPISLPIEHQMQALRQMMVGQDVLVWDTASDWGDGIDFVNIDTTTISGIILINPCTFTIYATIESTYTTSSDFGTCETQYVSTTTSSGNVVLKGNISQGASVHSLTDISNAYKISDNNNATYCLVKTAGIPETTSIYIDYGSTVNVSGIKIVYKTVTSGSSLSTVYISTRSNPSFPVGITTGGWDYATSGDDILSESITPTTTYLSVNKNTQHVGINVVGTVDIDFYLYELQIYSSSGNITFPVIDITTTPISNGSISAGISTNTATDILIQTRSSEDNSTWSSWANIGTTSGTINSPLNRYVGIKAFLNTTDYLQTPILSSVTVHIDGIYYHATYTTHVSTASSSFSSWMTFNSSIYESPGSSIAFYIQCSTANDNRSSRPYLPIINNGVINTSVNPYIWVTSSWTVSSLTAIPRLERVNVSYRSNQGLDIVGITYKDRYFIGVSTNNTDNVNDLIYVYDTKGNWIKFTGHMGSACIYNNQLYIGESRNTGKIYRAFTDDVYTDDGASYESYYVRGIDDCGYPINEKTFYDMWVSAQNEDSGTMDIEYRLDGSTGTWTSKTYNLNNGYGLIKQKINFEGMPKSYYIQFKVYNNTTNNFKFKSIKLNFNIENER